MQMMPSSLMVLPEDRGSARQTPAGELLVKLNTSTLGVDWRKSTLNGPWDTQDALPQSGGIGTPFA
jgi:hypothetical protein